MGTRVELLVPAGREPDARRLAGELFARWEAGLSRFRPESDLSRLNALAGRAVPVGRLLLAVVEEALRAAEATGGLYDPALLTQLTALGYDRSFDELPCDGEDHSGAPRPGGRWREIRVDPDAGSVHLPAGVGLDLGGLAKGMAVDACGGLLRARGIVPALVSAGGDLAVAGAPAGGTGWTIALPEAGDAVTVVLRRGALATSSVRRRRWRRGGAERHHLIDPRTGLPAASGLSAVSVAADRCAQAEVAAKCALLLGPEDGRRFLDDRELPGLLATDVGEVLASAAWPVEAVAA